MDYKVRIGEQERLCHVQGSGGRFRVTVDDATSAVIARTAGGGYQLSLDGQPLPLSLTREDLRSLNQGEEIVRPLADRDRALACARVTRDAASASAGVVAQALGDVAALMPGTIVRVLVEEGQAVRCGEVLLLLEAMKMENEICAPCDGVVSQLPVKAGDRVAKGQVLAHVEGATG
jgi:biotin carboxyl carrier protein